MITLSIDVTMISKERLKEVTRRNGQKAKFLNLVMIPTPNSEFGDYIVKESVTKEEKASGLELPILGNAKHVVRHGSGGTSLKHTSPNEKDTDEVSKDDGEDIPF